MSLLWAAVWGMVGLLAGSIVFAIGPMSIAMFAGGEQPQKTAQKYSWLAMSSIRRCALVARDNSLDIVKTANDPHKTSEKYELDGEKGNVRDDLGVSGRLHNKPFGITTDDVQSYLSPLASEISDAAVKAKRLGNLGRTSIVLAKGDNAESVPAMMAGVTIPKRAQLSKVESARQLLTGSASYRDGEVSKDWAVKSQELFHEKVSIGQALVFLLSVATGFAMIFIAFNYGDIGPGGGADRSVSEGALLLFAIAPLKERLSDAFERLKTRIGSADRKAQSADGESESSFGKYTPEKPAVTDDANSGQGGRDPLSFFKSESFMLMLGWSVVLVLLTAIVITALTLNGVLSAISVTLGIIIGSLSIPIGVALMGPSIPGFIGAPLARAMFILAQMTARTGVFVRLETGEWVYAQLREADDALDYDYYVLHEGKTIEIDGDIGDSYLFGWRPVGITEEKGQKNLGPISHQVESHAVPDGGLIKDARDQGYQGVLPDAGGNEAVIRLRSVYDWVRGSSESKIIEQGIQEALEQEGGQQQFGAIATIIGCFSGVILGAAIAFVALGGI